MIILALVITGIAYFVFPLIYVHTNGKVDNKKAWKIAIINFIICHMIFIGIAVSVGMDGGSASAAPVLWLFLTQSYLHDKNQDGIVSQKKENMAESNVTTIKKSPLQLTPATTITQKQIENDFEEEEDIDDIEEDEEDEIDESITDEEDIIVARKPLKK